MGEKVHAPYATFILGVLFFIEAIFFLPTDPILILYCLERRDKALYFALIATITSVAGGLTAYWLGYILWQSLGETILDIPAIAYIIPRSTFTYLCTKYSTYAALAVLIAAFTPVPYKAATLTAGICQIPIAPFIIYSLIGRGARFFLLAGAITLWGAKIKKYIDHSFNLFIVLIISVILLTLWFIK